LTARDLPMSRIPISSPDVYEGLRLFGSVFCCLVRLFMDRMLLLFVVRRHLVLDVPNKSDPHLSNVVASECIAHEMGLDRHLYLQRHEQVGRSSDWRIDLTISSAPRNTPQRMLENQSSSWARPSSGSSTKSARGFSSNNNENCLLSAVQFVTVGVMFRKILNPT
jgi:hypothetical protein